MLSRRTLFAALACVFLCRVCSGWGPIAHRTQMLLMMAEEGQRPTVPDLVAATAPDALRDEMPWVHNITSVTCAALLAKTRQDSTALGVFVRMGMHLLQDKMGHRTAVTHHLPLHIEEFAADTEHLWKQPAPVVASDDELAFSNVAEAVHAYTWQAPCVTTAAEAATSRRKHSLNVSAERVKQKLRLFEALVRLDAFFAFFNTPLWRLEFFGKACAVQPGRACSMAGAARWRDAVLSASPNGAEDILELSRSIAEIASAKISPECMCAAAVSAKTQVALFTCTLLVAVTAVACALCFVWMKRRKLKKNKKFTNAGPGNSQADTNQHHVE